MSPSSVLWSLITEGWEIQAGEATILLTRRPHYCDRGQWLAHLSVTGELGRSVDFADLWPRYYFDLGRAKLECEAWLRVRGQLL